MVPELDLCLKPNSVTAILGKCVTSSKLEFSPLQNVRNHFHLSYSASMRNVHNTLGSVSGTGFSTCFEPGQEKGLLFSSGPSNFTFGVLAEKIK